METVAKLIGYIVLIPLVPIYRGLIFKIVWKWFVTPSLNVQPINLTTAIGLMFIITMLRPIPSKTENDYSFNQKFWMDLACTLIIFGMCYIVHLFQ